MKKKRERTVTLTSVSDFCFLNGRTDARLSDVERLTMIGGAGLDRILSKLGKTLENVSLASFSDGLKPEQLEAHRERLHELRASGAIADLFKPVPERSEPSIVPIHGFPGGSVIDLEFRSHFPPPSWTHDSEYGNATENRTSYVRLWEHNTEAPPRTTIVGIHGWTMGDQRVNSLAFMPGLFYSLGCNVALVELPFHGRRRPPQVAEDVPLFPSTDPVRTCVAMAHALHDLRCLSAFLRRRGHGSVSCVGMSLGAYIGALWSALDKLDRAVLLVPLVSMGDMAFELVKRMYPEGSPERNRVDLALVRDLFADHYPLKSEPCTPQESVMVIRGKGDQLVSRSQIAILRKSWPRAKYLWAEGGHGAATKRGDTFSRMTDFLLSEG